MSRFEKVLAIALPAAAIVLLLVLRLATGVPRLEAVAVAFGPLWLYYLAGGVRAAIQLRGIRRARRNRTRR